MARTKEWKESSQRYVYSDPQSNLGLMISIPQVTSEKITLSVDNSKDLELPERLRLYVCSHRMLAMD